MDKQGRMGEVTRQHLVSAIAERNRKIELLEFEKMELCAELSLVQYELTLAKDMALKTAKEHALELKKLRDEYDGRMQVQSSKIETLELQNTELLCEVSLLNNEIGALVKDSGEKDVIIFE